MIGRTSIMGTMKKSCRRTLGMYHHHGFTVVGWLMASVFIIGSAALAADTTRAGRYLDRNVLVHDPASLNPLLQVAEFTFTDRLTMREAIRSVLTGSGYTLGESDEEPVQTLLDSRLAVPHLDFSHRRLDSVLSALVGVGRGFDIHVDHTAREIRIVTLPPPFRYPGGGS